MSNPPLPSTPAAPLTEPSQEPTTSASSSTALPSISTWNFSPLLSISAFAAPAPVPIWPDAPRRSTSPARFTTPPPKPTLTLLAFANEILYNILEFLVPVDVKNIRSHPFVALSSSCRLLYHLIETRCFRVLRNAAEDPRSRLAAMDESVCCCRPCDKRLHKLYDMTDVRSAEEMWGAYIERKFGFDADLICAARRAQILARPVVAMDAKNSAQSREQAARTFWADMRQDWDVVYAQTGLVLKRPTDELLDLTEASL
ncbi:hypothetical protein BZA05DRAFT_444938 [Tricharina praecox]|uniref:uncharacterized protein n=1 Tax=Tricharina praecox TaxID=43433 RepID=UPI0022208CE2|nr:uncharacterized protein BZA05DRAFT_444938 [Tricharina praecox]KAI5851768.1 hypothetical protein BZA05DRAFT_444938 [Tricharina praecox]